MAVVAPWSNAVAACAPALAAALMAALPAASALAAGQEVAAAPAQAALRWPIPVLRIGGLASYHARRELDQGHRATQHGTTGMLNVGTDTYLWEPWFAQLSARIGVTSARQAYTDAAGSDNASRSTFVTGETRLELVPASSFPFELHYQRSDSRSASQLTFDNALSASRLGFTQRLGWNGGHAMIGWDRSTQDEVHGGRARQDSTQLSLTQPFGAHVLRMSGASTRNRRGAEWANDGNLSLVHDYQQADRGLTVNSLAHLNNASYRIGEQGGQSGMLQLSSLAMWRPDDSDLAAVAGVRLLGFDGGRDGVNAGATASVRNANLNGGASYDLTPAIRFDGSANLNYNKIGSAAMVSTQQTVRASYLPDPVARGNTRYGWNAAAGASNSAGEQAGGRQLTLQLGHNAAHTLQVGRAGFSIDGAQSISARASSAKGPGAARHLSHSASVAWSLLSGNGVSASASASASDTRELSGTGEFYQLLTLQGTSNLVSGAYGSLSGNLTVQAARQRGVILVGDGSDPLQRLTGAGDKEVTTVSSGALAYHNERWFGVPRLRLSSSLRLNSQALLPVLGKAGDQQTAAWETELEYRIGLTTVRFAYLAARTPVGVDWRRGQEVAPGGVAQGAQRTRRAAQFWLSRSFGRW